ncbi:MAG: antibiotic biosynthesis monooxygenase [Pleurocapsa minor GSE-CHR-MK-17-07R]|jgi:heme-degrading monooxygenase HmoA|nr:antibiotic biosynthesis monooxygenase [Pleurocapsa minor GSE-CHR-MK 17-07R]
MILEHIVLNIIPGQSPAFEQAMRDAAHLLAATPGYIRHSVRKCIETPDRYLLLVEWETLEAHMVSFREGPNFPQWRAMTHHLYAEKPLVQHYEGFFENP